MPYPICCIVNAEEQDRKICGVFKVARIWPVKMRPAVLSELRNELVPAE
jgi:hypothetical protein